MDDTKYKYKVWIHVEMAKEEDDDYEDLGLPIEAGVFETEEEAWELAYRLERIG